MLKELKNEKNVIDSDYSSITFKELSDSFIGHNLIYKEPNTIEGYRNSHSKFKNLDDLKVKDIKKINIQKCIDTMVAENLKVSTIKTNLRKIKLFFKYYIENYDLNYQDPVFKMILPKEKNKTVKKALTKAEMYDLFKTIKNNKILKCRFKKSFW